MNETPPRYHIARQRHLGKALDGLQASGRLDWTWRYGPKATAHYLIRAGHGEVQDFETRDAEKLVQFLFDAMGVTWKPMPYTGYRPQEAEVVS